MTLPAPSTACACRCTLLRHAAPCTGVATSVVVRSGGSLADQTYPACKNCADATMVAAVKKYGNMGKLARN